MSEELKEAIAISIEEKRALLAQVEYALPIQRRQLVRAVEIDDDLGEKNLLRTVRNAEIFIEALRDSIKMQETRETVVIETGPAVCPHCDKAMEPGVACTSDATIELDGKTYDRIPYQHGGGKAYKFCHDCNTPIGGLHHPGCDMETCPKCGRQLITCDCQE